MINNQISLVNEVINAIANGDLISLEKHANQLKSTEIDPEYQELVQSTLQLAEKHQQATRFISDLASGNLSTEPPRHNRYIDSFKELHSNLRHLVWQVEQIAAGDYNQQIAFSGDFTKSFLAMTNALRQKDKAEKELKESENRFRILTETTTSGIFVYGNHKVIRANPAVSAITGFSMEELHELNILDFIYTEDSAKLNDFVNNDIVDPSLPSRYILRIIPKNGELKWIDLSVAKIKFEGVDATIGTFFDITEIKKITQELEKLNKTKDKFFSIIAHDLRSPFNAFLGLTEVMITDLQQMSLKEIQELAEMLNASANHLYTLLENLLEWAQLQKDNVDVHMEAFYIEESIKEASKDMMDSANSKHIALNFRFEENHLIYSDRNMIRAIVRNITYNAIKYTNIGGQINISVTLDEDFCTVKIQDNGIGMSPELKSKLFKMDEKVGRQGTNNEPSTGLGLLLCKEYIDKLGGVIEVESTEHVGTEFTVIFPATA
jgi:PAS domain S-box-containing protein